MTDSTKKDIRQNATDTIDLIDKLIDASCLSEYRDQILFNIRKMGRELILAMMIPEPFGHREYRGSEIDNIATVTMSFNGSTWSLSIIADKKPARLRFVDKDELPYLCALDHDEIDMLIDIMNPKRSICAMETYAQWLHMRYRKEERDTAWMYKLVLQAVTNRKG